MNVLSAIRLIVTLIIQLLKKFLDWLEQFQQQKSNGKVVAFIDLLGFKNYVTKGDPTFAYMLLNDFHSQIITRMSDSSLPKAIIKGANAKVIRFLEEANGIDSFEEFHPFSDSVFLASTDPDRFVLQLSTLLVDSFMLTADAFDREIGPDQITRLQVRYPVIDAEGKVRIEEETEVRYPILLRGGVVFDDAKVAHIPGLTLGKPMKNATLVGPGVIKAYGIEQLHIKGPRIICDENFARQVNRREAKILLNPTSNKNYFDMLWPAAQYFDAGPEADVQAKTRELFRRASNLWKAFSHLEFGIHYYNFLKLVTISTRKYFKGTHFEGVIDTTLNEEIVKNSLTLYKADLMQLMFNL